MKQDKSGKMPIDAGDIQGIAGALNDILAINAAVGNIATNMILYVILYKYGKRGKNNRE
jgi:hypothetical protein